MMPLGYIRSYQDFGQQFRQLVHERNHGGHAFGFLFDDPHLTIERSRLTHDNRALRTLNEELGEHMTVFYLHDSSVRITTPNARKLYRERIDEFNRTLISSLGVPEESIRLPCLTMFQIHDNACSHLMQIPLEPRSPLFLVTDIAAGIRCYRTFISSGSAPQRSYAAGSWSAVRASLTLADLVNTVTDFAERATQVVVAFLL
jgi:hypothetical protein